jgi:hypothetical protein
MLFKLKIFATNWVNLITIFLILYVSCIIAGIINSESFFTTFIGSILAIILYGFVFWLGFIIVMFLMDLILMTPARKRLELKLVIEWGLVSGLLINWFLEYNQWILLVAVFAFLLGQYFRYQLILSMINSKLALSDKSVSASDP